MFPQEPFFYWFIQLFMDVRLVRFILYYCITQCINGAVIRKVFCEIYSLRICVSSTNYSDTTMTVTLAQCRLTCMQMVGSCLQ